MRAAPVPGSVTQTATRAAERSKIIKSRLTEVLHLKDNERALTGRDVLRKNAKTLPSLVKRSLGMLSCGTYVLTFQIPTNCFVMTATRTLKT